MKVSAPREFQLTPNPEQAAANPPPQGGNPPPDRDASALASWPGWYAHADKVLVLLLSLSAFLLASSIARNSEFWRHIACGRLIVQGKYLFGTDPLCYTTAGRPWFNANWIYDLWQYLLYSLDPSGATAVVMKALAYMGSFLILMRLRPLGASMWPWAITGGLAVLACELASSLRPGAYALVLFAIVLTMLLKEGCLESLRNRVLFCAVVVLWANVDSTAFLAPWLVLALLIGECLHPMVLGRHPDDPPGRAGKLARLLPLTILAVFANPSLIAGLFRDPIDVLTQMIPFELSARFNPLIGNNPDLKRLWALSIIDRDYIARESHGNSINGFSALAIFLLGGVALFMNSRSLKLSHVAVWVMFGLLPIVNYRWLPWFALAVYPVVALQWNALSSRIVLGTPGDQKTRLLLMGSGVGRIFSLALGLLMVLLAWPGWLHPKRSTDAAQAQYVEWRVEFDPSVAEVARRLEDWRNRGEIPADYRGFNFRAEFGDYAAWFAPGQRLAYNTRFRLHAGILNDYFLLQNSLSALNAGESIRDSDVSAILNQYECDYLVVSLPYSITNFFAMSLLESNWRDANQQKHQTYYWWQDGHAAVIARDDPRHPELRSRREYSAIHEAFRSDQTPVPSISASDALPPAGGWEFEYVHRTKLLSSEYNNARFFQILAGSVNQPPVFMSWYRDLHAGLASIGGVTLAELIPSAQFLIRPASNEELAWSLLALRASRRTIADNPENPLAYLQLARVCQMQYLIWGEAREAQIQQMTALMRAHRRFHHARNPLHLRETIENDLLLFQLQLAYRPVPQVDLGLQTLDQLGQRLESLTETDLPEFPIIRSTLDQYAMFAQAERLDPLPIFDVLRKEMEGNRQPNFAVNADRLRRIVKELTEALTRYRSQRNERYTAAVQSRYSRADLIEIAVANGLYAKALESLAEVENWKSSDFLSRGGPPGFMLAPHELYLMRASLLFQTGHLEEGSKFLDQIEDLMIREANKLASDPRAPRWRQILQQLRSEEHRLSGNFAAAAELLADQIRQIPVSLVETELLRQRVWMLDPKFAQELIDVGSTPGIAEIQSLTVIRNRVLNRADLTYRMGMIHLHAGDIPKAVDAFESTLRPGGIPLRELGLRSDAPMIQYPEKYLKLIAAARPTPR